MPSTASSNNLRLSLIALTSDIMSCLGTTGFPTSSSALPLSIPSRSSPEPNSVDTYITDLLQAVTSDDVPICSSCEEGTTATFKCKDCSEMLCDPCVKAHQRVRITKEHSIVKFSNEIGSVNATTNGSLGSCSLASNSPCSSGLDTGVNFCDLHHEPHRLYCESCLLPICTECTLSDHRGHQLAYIQDAIDTARTTTLKLCAETRSAIAAVRDAIDNVQRASESVEIRSHQAAADVRSFIQRFVAALEEREHELLSRIDHIRQVKSKGLVAQMDNLRVALTKLSMTSDLLTESLANGSGVDLIMTNEKAATELKQVRAIRADLVPCESDNIFFIQPDLLLKNINSVGYISTVPAGNVQQRNRVVKETAPSFIPPIELKADTSVQLRGAPRGRPIHGIAAPVIARDAGTTTSLIFGTEGENDGQLCRPWGVCCDRNGKIIVADRSNNRIQVFHPNGLFSHKFGTQGTGPGQFDRPAGVAIDPVGRIVVADKDNHRIQLFTIEGTFVLTFGDKGCRNGQFNYPWDVAVNSQGNIVVTDTRNHRIQLFTNEGVFLNKYGFEGSATMWKHFDSPRGVCFNPSGHIVVTDFNNHRLVVVDPSFLHAQFLGQEGSGFKQFLRPQGIVCDDEGRIIVADSRNNRIQVFEGNGTFLWKCGQAGKGPGELDRPSGICLTPEGRIVVVDFGNNRVQIF